LFEFLMKESDTGNTRKVKSPATHRLTIPANNGDDLIEDVLLDILVNGQLSKSRRKRMRRSFCP
jgi:hypothetical protein